MKMLLFSLRMLKRDWQAGELRIVFISLVIAVASMSSVNFFVDRIDKSLRQHANELLAADLVIKSDHLLDKKFRTLATELQLKSVDAILFRSMVLAGERSHLAEIKAVGHDYPLRGQLRTTEKIFGPETIAAGIPRSGTVWLDPELLMRLKLNIGDRLSLGNNEFTVATILAYEPDRGSGMFNIAPRLLLNMDDLAATQLIQEGSRVSYQFLLAGENDPVEKYKNLASTLLTRGEKLIEVTDARQEVREALKRAQGFLGLAALVSVILAGVAMAMAIRSYVRRHMDNCAIMRCVGATQHFVFSVYLMEMIWLGVLASLFGCLIGYLGHAILINVLGQLLVVELPAPSWFPFIFGMTSGLFLLFIFVIPPLLQLKNVPTMRVIRREMGTIKATTFSAISLGMVTIAGLLIWQAGDIKLGVTVFAGLLATIGVLALVSYLLLFALQHLRTHVGVSWRFGIVNISRRAKSSVAQIVAFGIGMMALLLLSLVTNDLLKAWKNRLPVDTPNRFVINIQQDQFEDVEEFFKLNNFNIPKMYPMVQARLQKINDRSVSAEHYEDARAKRLVERQFNLSWTDDLQEDNKIVAGQWWSKETMDQSTSTVSKSTMPKLTIQKPTISKPKSKGLLSIEEDIAKTLGIKLGDELVFSLSGETYELKVSSIRQVAWDSFRVNFFALVEPGLLENYPASYITSFYLPDVNKALLTNLVQKFPNLTIVDISSIMNKIRDIILRVTDAVQYVFIFTLFAGLVVLYAAIQSTHDERIKESAMLRTFGASRQQMVKGLLSEFVTLGALSGFVAALASTVLAYVLAEYIMEISFTFNIWIWMIGPLGGAIGVGLAGYLGVRKLLNQPPIIILQGINDA